MDTYITIITISVIYGLLLVGTLGGLIWAEVLDGRDEAAHRLELNQG